MHGDLIAGKANQLALHADGTGVRLEDRARRTGRP